MTSQFQTVESNRSLWTFPMENVWCHLCGATIVVGGTGYVATGSDHTVIGEFVQISDALAAVEAHARRS